MATKEKRLSDIRPLLEAIAIAEPLGLGDYVQRAWKAYLHADLARVLNVYRWVHDFWATFGEPGPGELRKLEVLILILTLLHAAEQKYYTDDYGEGDVVS